MSRTAISRMTSLVDTLNENNEPDSLRLMRVRPRSVGYSERHWRSLTAGDLRAVLALAKQAAELKRRVRLAADSLSRIDSARRWELGSFSERRLSEVEEALNLRRPLPKGRK